MLCSKLHCQSGFHLMLFSCKNTWRARREDTVAETVRPRTLSDTGICQNGSNVKHFRMAQVSTWRECVLGNGNLVRSPQHVRAYMLLIEDVTACGKVTAVILHGVVPCVKSLRSSYTGLHHVQSHFGHPSRSCTLCTVTSSSYTGLCPQIHPLRTSSVMRQPAPSLSLHHSE